MFEPVPAIAGKTIDNVKKDFSEAEKVEQYRISNNALYLPEGLRWKYYPLDVIQKAEESFRVISAGHCVPVREKRPELDLETGVGRIHLQLEKTENLRKILSRLDLKTAKHVELNQ